MVLAVLVGADAWAQCDPGRAGVVVNEFVPNPSATEPDAEWVEIKNGSAQALDLSGWLVAGGTSAYGEGDPFPAGTTLAAGGYLVVGNSAIPGVTDLVAAGFTLGNTTSNSDAVQLRDCFGGVVDTVVYGDPNEGTGADEPWVDDGGGVATSLGPGSPDPDQSLGRDPDGRDTDQSAADLVELPYVTPGRANDAPPDTCGGPESGLKINEILPDPDVEGGDDGHEWVELYHAGSAPIDLTNWSLAMGTSSLSVEYTWKSGTLNPGDRLLLGGPYVAGVDVVVDGMSLGNASNTDVVAVLDCLGFPADTLVYGAPNDDGHVDDSGEVATSLAAAPGTAAALQRVSDGYDTDQCKLDFAVTTTPTPGAPNPEIEPVVCVPSDGSVRINEFLPDPDVPGGDDGFEWVELYNGSASPVSVAGWGLAFATQPDDQAVPSVRLGGGLEIPAGGFLVIGGEGVEESDVVLPFSIGNGTETDAVRLFDCEDTVVDTVLYGDEPNADGMTDDQGEVVEPYGDPGAEDAMARVADGVDTDTADDWKVVGVTTPGASNVRDLGTIEDPLADGPRRCGCGDDTPTAGTAPEAGDPNGGCATLPPPPFPVLALLVLVRRRRR